MDLDRIGNQIVSYGDTIPDGSLLCDGTAVDRQAFFKLFSVIGTVHGAGDGVNTFNLPDETPFPENKKIYIQAL